MSKISDAVAVLIKNWGSKTLEDFRLEGEREKNGTVFESMREDGGQRYMLILCLTNLDQIAALEKCMELVDDGGSDDWKTATLADLAVRVVRGTGLGVESLRDSQGRRSAVILVATAPDSIRLMETVFELPNVKNN